MGQALELQVLDNFVLSDCLKRMEASIHGLLNDLIAVYSVKEKGRYKLSRLVGCFDTSAKNRSIHCECIR